MSDIQIRFIELMDHLWAKGGYGNDQRASEELGIPKTTISALRTGRQQPTAKYIQAICTMAPQFSLWLCTGRSWEVAGQTSPQDVPKSANQSDIGLITLFLKIQAPQTETDFLQELAALNCIKLAAEERKRKLIEMLKQPE